MGAGFFAEPNPSSHVPQLAAGLLRLEPHFRPARTHRRGEQHPMLPLFGQPENAMNRKALTLKFDESGKPFHIRAG